MCVYQDICYIYVYQLIVAYCVGVLPARRQGEVARPGGVAHVRPRRHQSLQHADGLHRVRRRSSYHR